MSHWVSFSAASVLLVWGEMLKREEEREVQISQEASEWLPNSHPDQVPRTPALPASVPTLMLAVGGCFMRKPFYLCLHCLPKQVVSA